VDILKGVEVLIGLAVTMLIASTVVTAVTQLFLSTTYARARHLREGIQQLVAQIDPELLAPQSRYLAERLLRHPLVGRRNTPVGWATGGIRNGLRALKKPLRRLGFDPNRGLPLPRQRGPGDALQREEIVLFLLEWAAGEGPLSRQDGELADAAPAVKGSLLRNRETLRRALLHAGIADPAGVARAVRLLSVQNESTSPKEPAQQWRVQAFGQIAPNDLVAKVFGSFDNTTARMTETFGLEAKVASSIIALGLCLAIQLDSVGLLRRLSRDDSLRASLVAQAEKAVKQSEEEMTPLGAAATKPPSDSGTSPEEQQQRAIDARNRARAALEVLQDPRLAVVPDHFVWDAVAQAELRTERLKATAGTSSPERSLVVGEQSYPLVLAKDVVPTTEQLEDAVRRTGALVDVYPVSGGLLLVARSTAIAAIDVTQDGKPMGFDCSRRLDKKGLAARLPGLLFSWILLSLGAPFWYDALKKLLGFRSLLLYKDDEERKARAEEQPKADAAAPSPVPVRTLAPPPLEGTPGVVSTVAEARLRFGYPSTSASGVRLLPSGTIVSVAGSVKGEPVTDSAGTPNDRWYQTLDGEYLWAGATDTPRP
jgi:hypothetical protein